MNLQAPNFQRCKCAFHQSGMSEIAACPPSPIPADPSALPSPTSPPSWSQEPFLPVHSTPAPVWRLLYCTTVLFKILYYTIQKCSLYFLLYIAFYILFVQKLLYSLTQLGPTLYDPMDCNLPGSSVHGILQAKILEWVAISPSRGSSLPWDQTCISYISALAGGFFTTGSAWKAPLQYSTILLYYCTVLNSQMCSLGPRLSLLVYKQTGLTNTLSKWNWFIHTGITVIRCDNLGKGPDIN